MHDGHFTPRINADFLRSRKFLVVTVRGFRGALLIMQRAPDISIRRAEIGKASEITRSGVWRAKMQLRESRV